MAYRIHDLRKLMLENKLDGVFVYSGENRRYLSGFTGSTGFLIIGKGSMDFVTDFRYMEQAEAQCKDCNIIIHRGNLMETLAEAITKAGIKKLGIEEDFMTVMFCDGIRKALPGVEPLPAGKIFKKLRIKKDKTEIENIRKAAAIADDGFKHILGYIRPGLSEIEVASELEYFMKKKGASGTSFDTIAASGVRSSFPHGVASEKIIEETEFLTLDFGCVYNGYCSDMTRTVFIGKAAEKHRKIYDIVLRANIEALKGIRPGITGRAADKIARDVIDRAGYGEYFGHGLGHGVGLAVHEDPRLSMLGDDTLEAGMIVTDEPGIYIPGFGGVRIEDLVLIMETGAEAISKSPKELIEL
ncbi:MAG: Xaa-Pro peptidase family protein [Clostridiaceae bacterium]|nr:Xaa-Pro peptidase family protein [Clostridiaceae bacterium]